MHINFATYPYELLGGLDGAVENAVGWHDEVGFLRDVEALAQGMAGLLKALGLIHKQVGGEHDTIADNVHLAPLENAGGNGAEHVFLTIKLQGVSCVRAALEARHGVVAWCEDINYLSLTFIAPLNCRPGGKCLYDRHQHSRSPPSPPWRARRTSPFRYEVLADTNSHASSAFRTDI